MWALSNKAACKSREVAHFLLSEPVGDTKELRGKSKISITYYCSSTRTLKMQKVSAQRA